MPAVGLRHLGLRHLGLSAGTAALLACACGDTTGTPLVAVNSGPGLTDPPPADDGELATGPVFGLCDPCQENQECGDRNDYCLYFGDDPTRFCGRDCQEGRGCPAGYECVGLANASGTQCVPEARTCQHRADIATPPRLAELRALALDQLNTERQGFAVPPLVSDECLNEIAQTSSREFALSGQRGTKYARECATDLPSCACGWTAEHQTSIAEYELAWPRAVTVAIDLGLGANATGEEPALLTTSSTRVGIGVLLGGDEAWITFALGE